ncbi:MAG TPA: nucleotidyl transferase AbiEii/AbiGii toxin family protein [Gemmatimonadales bacterium]|nr:nucleotidyl transferase AbiEii/AbiGii toxin family protein [Gemmatimonadales bacterium]
MNPDFSDILFAFSAEDVEFLVVGAYALAAHGLPRATRDLDLWVGTTGGNPERVRRALIRFGAPVEELSPDDLRRPDLVFQIGVAPQRIDVLTSIDGVEFAAAWPGRLEAQLEGMRVPVLSREHLIQNKRAAGRPQDLADVAWLEGRR